MASTGISYGTKGHNVMCGCTPCSRGCKRCWAKEAHDMRHKAQLAGKRVAPQYAKPFETIQLFAERLGEPLHWTKPQTVVVCFQGDLFHGDVPNKFIAAEFAVMAACPQHTFLLLTKQAQRQTDWFGWLESAAEASSRVFPSDSLAWRRAHCLRAAAFQSGYSDPLSLPSVGELEARGWPLRNVVLGFTVEGQPEARERARHLAAAALAGWRTWFSVEPQLESVDLRHWLGLIRDASKRLPHVTMPWVVTGGESGHGAREYQPGWARELREQAREFGAAFYMKQMGSVWARASGIGHGEPNYSTAGDEPGAWPADLQVREPIPAPA